MEHHKPGNHVSSIVIRLVDMDVNLRFAFALPHLFRQAGCVLNQGALLSRLVCQTRKKHATQMTALLNGSLKRVYSNRTPVKPAAFNHAGGTPNTIHTAPFNSVLVQYAFLLTQCFHKVVRRKHNPPCCSHTPLLTWQKPDAQVKSKALHADPTSTTQFSYGDT